MASLSTPSGEIGKIACCTCGVLIAPNQANMCLACLSQRVNIGEGISTSGLVMMCTECGRFCSSDRWLKCEPESAELLALCLKAVHGLGRGKGSKKGGRGAKFVDASFIWTEPHSRRIKLNVTVEKELEEFNNAVVQQNLVVELVVRTRLCDICTKESTDQNWTTIVQVRQQVQHKRTLLNLENQLMKNGAANKALRVLGVKNGLDFYFATPNAAKSFTDHVLSCVPARRKESKSLVGADLSSNTYRFRISVHVEVVPICKGDFVLLPKKLSNALFGGKASSVLVDSIATTINLVDPVTNARAKLGEAKYWPNAFPAYASTKDMIEFIVLDVEPLDYAQAATPATSEAEPGKASEAQVGIVEVARASDFGVNDERFSVNSHIAAFLEAGDSVLGFDFANRVDDETVKGDLPSVVLVQKMKQPGEGDRRKKSKKKKKNGKKKQQKQQNLSQVEVEDLEDYDFDLEDDFEAMQLHSKTDADEDEDDSGNNESGSESESESDEAPKVDGGDEDGDALAELDGDALNEIDGDALAEVDHNALA